jgi:sulfur carrier protein
MDDSGASIELLVNGQRAASTARTLEALLDEQGFGGAKVATAVNGAFVPETRRSETLIGAGDRVEILTARQGG